jgi:hypothetical protein
VTVTPTCTRYFVEQVLRKRPALSEALCRVVLAKPLQREQQDDGRIRHWGRVLLPGEEKERILRVVTLVDGVTIHNAFPDRNYDGPVE